MTPFENSGSLGRHRQRTRGACACRRVRRGTTSALQFKCSSSYCPRPTSSKSMTDSSKSTSTSTSLVGVCPACSRAKERGIVDTVAVEHLRLECAELHQNLCYVEHRSILSSEPIISADPILPKTNLSLPFCAIHWLCQIQQETIECTRE